jgi:hypothetical protein
MSRSPSTNCDADDCQNLDNFKKFLNRSELTSIPHLSTDISATSTSFTDIYVPSTSSADIALPSTSAACPTNYIPAEFTDLDEFFYSLITKNVVDQKCLTQAGAYAAGYLLKIKNYQMSVRFVKIICIRIKLKKNICSQASKNTIMKVID